jgi:hypothetical protein
MDMLLDTSFTILSYADCEEFFLGKPSWFADRVMSKSCNRLVANIMLWRVRHQIYDDTTFWISKLTDKRATEPSMSSVFTGLRIMEILTLHLAHALDKRDSTGVTLFKDKLRRQTKKLSAEMRVVKCFYERFVLHQVHSAMVEEYNTKHLKTLEKLLGVALRNKNFCSHDIIKHTLRCWRLEVSPEVKSFWVRHSVKENPLDLFKVPFHERVFPYSLPIARSGNFL